MNFKLSANFLNVIIIIVLIIILLNSPCISEKENFEEILGEDSEENFYAKEDY